MRGKYQMHKQLGIALQMTTVLGARHLPFPGIYYLSAQGGGGGGAGGSPVSEFYVAEGNGGYGGSLDGRNGTVRAQTPAAASGYGGGAGGAPGSSGSSGGWASLTWPEGSRTGWGGNGGSGYGVRTPTGNGGWGGAARGGYGSTGGYGGYSSRLIG